MFKKINFYNIIIILLVLLIALFTGLAIMQTDTIDIYRISILINDSDNPCWDNFIQGINQGAIDYNVEIDLVNIDTIDSKQEQLNLIEQQLENGTDAMIIQGEYLTSDDIIQCNVPVIMLENDIDVSSTSALFSSDNNKVGSALASEVILNNLGNTKYRRIGIVTGNSNQLKIEQRVDSFIDKMETVNSVIAWQVESVSQLSEIEDSNVNIMVCVNELMLDECVNYCMENNITLYAIGTSEIALYGLEKDIVKSLIVLNEYNSGYLAVKQLAQYLNRDTISLKDYSLSYRIINKDNMYNSSNENILFSSN